MAKFWIKFSICFNFWFISFTWVANLDALSFSNKLLADELVLMEECVLRKGFEDSLVLCSVFWEDWFNLEDCSEWLSELTAYCI